MGRGLGNWWVSESMVGRKQDSKQAGRHTDRQTDALEMHRWMDEWIDGLTNR